MKRIFQRFLRKKLSDKKDTPRLDDKFIPEELRLKKIGKKEVSPLNDPVWKASLWIVAGSILLGILQIAIGFTHTLGSWFLAPIALITWITAVRMLLMDSRLKKLWIGWLVLSIVLPVILTRDESLWMAAVGGSFLFLLFRKYRPYRHLTSRQRAVLFLLGFLVFILLSSGGRTISTSESDESLSGDIRVSYAVTPEAAGMGVFLSRYATASLELFWFFSLLHIFFRARLHFMKIRPKLAVSAFLIAVIPAFLIIFMGLIILYGTLGATRGTRVRSVLQDWAELASLDENFIPSLCPHSFVIEETGSGGQNIANQPPWLEEFIAALRSEESPVNEKTADNPAHYFWIESDLWIIHVKPETQERYWIQGGLVDSVMMNRLAKIVKSDVRFSPSMMFEVVGMRISTIRREAKKPAKKIEGRFIPEQQPPESPTPGQETLWFRPLGFGMTDVDIIELIDGKFERQKMLLVIEASMAGIFEELTTEKNPYGQAVMISLLAIAIMLLIFEAFILFFGIRITTGFTSAVRALYRGTERIARGDMDTVIEIPNEDELGDLAASFNAMTKAVRKGREESILRAHLESELAIARKIQERLLPHDMPQLSGFEIAGTSIPSKQVGGDYFDFLDLGKGRLGIAIADVSGKGIPAALLMANLQASLHAQALATEMVAEVAIRINDLLVRSTDGNMFVTFFYGLLDRNRSTFTSTNAGHNPPILMRYDRRIERLEDGGMVLGFLPEQKYAQQTATLKPGDILVLFTDGITEARDPNIEKVEDKLFGEEKLIQVIADHASLSAREIQAAILQAVTNHTKNTPQGDDITLVVIKRREV
jgi:serine phosphatase RsbU (regulator of sigma subunit)